MIRVSNYLQKQSEHEYVYYKNENKEVSFYHRGLFLYSDDTFDLYENPVLALCLNYKENPANNNLFNDNTVRERHFVKIELTLAKLVGNADVRESCVSAELLLDEDKKRYYIRRDMFSLPQQRVREYRFVSQIKISSDTEFEIHDFRLQQSAGISLSTEKCSVAGTIGDILSCFLDIENESEKEKQILLRFMDDGWTQTRPFIEGKERIWLNLKPYEKRRLQVSAEISESFAMGGFEAVRIQALEDGVFLAAEQKLWFGRELLHPCGVFDAKLLDDIKKKISDCDWAKASYEQAKNAADNWDVPKIDPANDYLFDTSEAHHARDCAIIYALGGDKKLADKVAAFLKEWSNTEYGYLTLPRAGNQELVHDGEFFKSAATAYDLIYDWEGWSDKDRENIEAVLRFYMKYIDIEIQSGEASNWLLAEIAGAIYSAAVLQDRERMERFLFGPGGAADQLSKGVLDDGWWFEASIGYNLMCAGLMSEISLAAAHFGIDFAHIHVKPVYRRTSCTDGVGFDGLSNEIWGENKKNYRSIDMLWDRLIPFYDYRGVIMGINDSAEQKTNAQTKAFYKLDYELAYYIYKKPEYAYLISNLKPEERNVLFGERKAPQYKLDELPYEKSCYAENAGSAVLRSHKKDRPIREQIQVGIKYGSHGGAHGHYDRASMNGLMRYGKSLTNPENIWYSYHTFMYKFYCQTSINHNMVTVDLKQQEAAPPKRLLFHSGNMMQAFGIENKSRWSYPPYGGWPVGTQKTIEERQWEEGRFFPLLPKETRPKYAQRSGFTEEIITRRVTVVTDDYVVNFDYAKSKEPHDFQCIYHLQGLRSQNDALIWKKHTAQLDADPLGSAQFMTDCEWYQMEKNAKLSFEAEYTEAWNNFNRYDWKWQNRTAYNEHGTINTDLYYLKEESTDQSINQNADQSAEYSTSDFVIANPPEFALVNKRLTWKIYGRYKNSETLLKEGHFGAWILGKEKIDLDISGVDELRLEVFVEDGRQGDLYCYESLDTIFWGNPVFDLDDNSQIFAKDVPYRYENTKEGNGAGIDYGGGRVMIEGEQYDAAIPAEPKDRRKPGSLIFDLSALKEKRPLRFRAVIGGDYPVGDESRKRKSLMEIQHGTKARFVTVIEPHEDAAMIKQLERTGAWSIKAILADGRTQLIKVHGLETENEEIKVEIEEYHEENGYGCQRRFETTDSAGSESLK